MFRTVFLSIIWSSALYTQQWYVSNRFADSYSAKLLVMDTEIVRNKQGFIPEINLRN